MKRILKWFGIIVGVLALAIGLLLFSMRFHDGPLEILSGGPFKTGELATVPADWSFLTDRSTLEFQTMDPAQSRTVWLAVLERRLFLVSGYMNTGYGAIWKQWEYFKESG